MKRRTALFWILDFGFWIAGEGVVVGAVYAMDPVGPIQYPKSKIQNAERIGDHRYRIGQVVVDTAAKVVQVPCRVNMRRGMIEFLAVASEGKLHESVLLAEAEPLHIHLALMLVGLDPGRGAQYHGDLAPPSGPGVEARVEWYAPSSHGSAPAESPPGSTEAVRLCSARLEQFAWDILARRPMPPVAWLFTGAVPPGRAPRTEEERSVVATFRDPDAVLTNPLPTGADDSVYKANERLIPPVGTRVTLLLRPADSTYHGGRPLTWVPETPRG
jgi:hypothetical protein